MTIPNRQTILLMIVFLSSISLSFEAKTRNRPQSRSQVLPADCGTAESAALEEITDRCMTSKWSGTGDAKSICCIQMNSLCATTNYMKVKCTPKADFDQKAKEERDRRVKACAASGSPWSASLCNSDQPIADGTCQQHRTYLDCKDITGISESRNQSGPSLRYPAVTELLLVALLIKYFI